MAFSKKNGRRHPRVPIDGQVRILWADADGREHVLQAKLLNISAYGIAFHADQAVPLRSYVTCNYEKLGIRGRGTVRHCTYCKGRYVIGVEFSGGTGWRDVPETVEAGAV